ncbi:MAG: YwmB family TATA-box binding protein [Dehalobacterium sp.]
MKRKNIYFLVFLGCLIAAGCYIHYYFNNIKPAVKTVSQPMQVAFQSSNAVFVETKLQGWAKINDRFSNKEELLSYGSQIEEILGLEDGVTKEEASDQGFNSLKIIGRISEKLSAEIIFQSLADTNGNDETYLIVNMVDYRGPGFLNLSKEKMVLVFQLFQQEPEINQLMIGFQDGKLSKKSYSDTINGIFSSVGGKISGEVEEENYFSSTGYVPNIEEKLQVGKKDINIQVAMSYDELENKTYIYIGSPLVYSDY